MTHRYYDAGKGRFINRDPIGAAGGINLYGFVGNNPVTGADPSGLRDLTKADYKTLWSLAAYGLQDDGRGMAQKALAHAVNGAIRAIKKSIAGSPSVAADPAGLRAAMWAIDRIGDPDYGDGNLYPGNKPVPPLSKLADKCNIFVGDAYALGAGLGYGGAGVPIHSRWFSSHGYPYVANELYLPTENVPHFPVDSSPQVGDIAAFGSIPGIGHATINLGGGAVVYGTMATEGSVKVGTVSGVSAWEGGVFPTYRRYQR